MKNNIRVNINGVIFNIDEDAHLLLSAYLDRLRFHFGNGQSADEIILDIEAGIAEMFIERKGEDTVVNKELVEEVIKSMGEPNEISDEEEPTTYSEPEYTSRSGRIKRKLYRDEDNKVVGGVAGGLSVYFDMDVIWIRLAFVLLTIFGMSILVYIVLWIVIPRATTTAQKLEMRGEEVTLENIKRTIRDEYDDIAESLNNIKDKHFKKKKGELTIFEKIAHVIIRILGGIIKFIGSFIGIILAFVALILIIAIVPTFIGGGVFLFSIIPGITMFSFSEFLNVFTSNSTEVSLIVNSLAMVLLIPLIALVYQGIKLIFGIRYNNKIIGITLFTLWITGVLLLGFSITRFANDFHREAEISHYIDLQTTESDTLYVELNNFNSDIEYPLINSMNGQFLFCVTDSMYYLNPKINTKIVESDEDFSIELIRISHGSSYRTAQNYADRINYSYTQLDSLITLAAYCSYPKQEEFRGQHMEIIIKIPEGKSVQFVNTKENEILFDLDICKEENNNSGFVFIDRENDRIIINKNGKDFEIYDDDINFD